MQDTAKSAWKSSKKFASSVITGGVNLTGCRKGSSDLRGGNFQTQQLPHLSLGREINQEIEPSIEQQQHTSVVQINGTDTADLSIAENQAQQQTNPSLIRVDASKKLTIVTKFNDDQLLRQPMQGQQKQSKMSNCSPAQSIETAPSSSGASERSRCESSSSGRGTSSDAGSAASQNGDDKEECQASAGADSKITAAEDADNEQQNMTTTSSMQQQQPATTTDKKAHKTRKSSLFKASKVVFGGSQASLNKLKNFFNGKQLKTQQQHSTFEGENYQNGGSGELAAAENSRLRCMELNQAIKVPSVAAISASQPQQQQQPTLESQQDASVNEANEESANTTNNNKEAEVEKIGQGETSDQQQQQQSAGVVCQ